MTTENDSVSTDAIGTLVVVLALAVVVVALGVTAFVRSEQNELDASRGTQANLRPLRELRASQLAELSAAPAWIDREKGVVSVPIQRAMELTLEQARSASRAPSASADAAVGGAPLPGATTPTIGAAGAGQKVQSSATPNGGAPSDPEHVH
jgi:hypothetical protein